MLHHHNNLCSFIPIDYETYQCKNCGVIMQSIDGYPPVFVCSEPLKGYKEESEIDFVTKLKNFAKSTVDHVSSGMRLCNNDQIVHRHNICRSCEFFKDDTCSKCGCPLHRTKMYISKLSWAEQECPIGKWGKETI